MQIKFISLHLFAAISPEIEQNNHCLLYTVYSLPAQSLSIKTTHLWKLTQLSTGTDPVLSASMKRGFQRRQRTQRISEFTQAPVNRNRAVLFPAELNFLKFKKI